MDKTAAGTQGGADPRRPQASLPVPKSKRGLKGFFNEVGREMKKVSWPPKAETYRLTWVVLAVCGIVVTILTSLSFVCGLLVDFITKGRV